MKDWFKKFKEEYIVPPPTDGKCEECNGLAWIRKVKHGKNEGRPYIACADQNCKWFKWLDLPRCDFCGDEKAECRGRGGKMYTRCLRCEPMKGVK